MVFMGSDVCVNRVYRDMRSDSLFRVLFIEPDRSSAYIFWMEGKSSVPKRMDGRELETGVSEGWLAEEEDPYTVSAQISDEDRKHRDKLWNKVGSALLDEPGIYDRKIRAEHLRRIEKESGEKMVNLYRHLERYWKRGKTPDAFLPGFKASGGRGKQRLGVTRANRNNKTDFGKPLTPVDILNFETAIHKYYLIKGGDDLLQTYNRLLEDSYSTLEKDENGKEKLRLFPNDQIPSLRQFRYWYTKTHNVKEEESKRKGETKFELTGRAILGKNEHGMMGPGSEYQVDATVGDIYLVSRFDRSDIIGRPVMYFVMDVASRIVTGMYIGLEGPSWNGMMMALHNAASDKVDYCHRYGIEITEDQWPCHHLPSVLLGDRGELESHKADNLVSMLGIRVDNAPPYRGDLKPVIERHFRTINDTVRPALPGWVMPDMAQRGGKDYRLDAKLDIVQFTRIIICCVIYYNTQHYLGGYEKNEAMLKAGVESIPVKLWEWGIRNSSGNLRTCPEKTLRLALMPKESGSVTEKGIQFKKLYYTCPQAREEQWFETARKNGRYSVDISYDPRDMDTIYVWKKDEVDAIECSLIDWEQRYSGKSCDEVHYEQVKQDNIRKKNERAEKEAVINLNHTIDAIVDEAVKMAPSTAGMTKAERLADIRENRKKERDALREEEAFTSEPGVPPQPVGEILDDEAAVPHGSEGAVNENIPAGEEWEKLSPIQKMLWKDLERRGNVDDGGESGIS